MIGDVCGKGASAARTTALARSAVRTAAHTESDPVAGLDTVNEVLLEWFGAGRSFVTAAYATLTRTPGPAWNVTVAGAGHPPAFLRRRDGTIEQLTGGGRVLGLTLEPHQPRDRDPGDRRRPDPLHRRPHRSPEPPRHPARRTRCRPRPEHSPPPRRRTRHAGAFEAELKKFAATG